MYDPDGEVRISSMKCVSATMPDPVNPPAMKTTAAFDTMAATPCISARFRFFLLAQPGRNARRQQRYSCFCTRYNRARRKSTVLFTRAVTQHLC